MTRTPGRELSARDAQKVMGIPEGTVRSWYARRARTGLWPCGEDRRGNPLFHEADLKALRAGRKLRGRDGGRVES